MPTFLDADFLLGTATAKKLYHDFAAAMPVIDYHNHLSPQQIAEDTIFENITQVWLYGDHYKWRAMRTNGVNEHYCTGAASDYEKFEQWAATVPYTLRNPLFHWTHLELQRYFNVDALLDADSARDIYETCSEKLRTPAYSVRNLLRKMNVRVLCTTDDPVDSLEHHHRLRKEGFEIRVLPAFRPDKAMQVYDVSAFNQYVNKLENSTSVPISKFDNFREALWQRHEFFAAAGCTVSDHGLEQLEAVDHDQADLHRVFSSLRMGVSVSSDDQQRFRSGMLLLFARWDHEKNWVQQFHLGAQRNNNRRKLQQLGADTGWDSIGDFQQARPLARFLDTLDETEQLAKTILYNLNPADNEIMATMAGNFNDGSVPGKVQYGAAWWFLDQKDGMEKQLNALSNMGLLSRFVGMLTDSRSFMSFPRHEYFRRLLCNLLGREMEQGELPANMSHVGRMVQDICYNNVRDYFGWK